MKNNTDATKIRIIELIDRLERDIDLNISFFLYNLKNNYEIINSLFTKYGVNEDLIKKSFSSFDMLCNSKKFFINFNNKLKQDLEDKNISVQYISLIDSEFSSFDFYFNTEYIVDYLNNAIHHLSNTVLDYQIQNQIFNNLNQLFESNISLKQIYPQKISQLEAFDLVKDTGKNENVVIIGANGSGKSSFSRNIKHILGTSIVIISAQKIFHCRPLNCIPVDDSKISEVRNYQQSAKMCNDTNFGNALQNDMNSLIEALIADYVHVGINFLQNRNTISKEFIQEPILEKVMKLWHEILPHRELNYDNKGNIKVYGEHCQDYDFMNLSDGEKAVFYYIGHILLARENSYIIIDEPENHLNLSVVNKMWDILEQQRTDCVFMYLTHNVSFASSRVNSRKLWMKSYNQEKFIWDVIPLPSDDILPESLYMELLGSRSKILFCEGDDNNSYDYKLYSLLFPEYNVKPVKGHIDVIQTVRAFNKNSDIIGNRAIGIIDRDFHSVEEINVWKKDEIYSLNVCEIENIFLDVQIIEHAIKQFLCSDTVQDIQIKLFEHFYNTIEKQIINYVRDKIKQILSGFLIKEKNDITKLSEEINNISNTIDVNNMCSDRRKKLKCIYDEKNYDDMILYSNDKSLCAELNKLIIKDYKEKVIMMIRNDIELKQYIKEKYFSEIN